MKSRAVKSLTIVLWLAAVAVVLPSGFSPVSASKMNGKCCQWSDGGRSHRYQMAIRRAAIPHTCSAYAASCIRVADGRADGVQMCRAAKAQCLETGVHVGPFSGMQYAGMQKK